MGETSLAQGCTDEAEEILETDGGPYLAATSAERMGTASGPLNGQGNQLRMDDATSTDTGAKLLGRLRSFKAVELAGLRHESRPGS